MSSRIGIRNLWKSGVKAIPFISSWAGGYFAEKFRTLSKAWEVVEKKILLPSSKKGGWQ